MNESVLKGRNLKVGSLLFLSMTFIANDPKVVPKRTNIPGHIRGGFRGRGRGGFRGGRGGGYMPRGGGYRGGYRGMRGRGFTPY